MSIPTLALSTGGSFLLLCLIFRPLEAVFPAKPGQRFFRPNWATDFCYFIGHYLLWGGALLWVVARFADGLHRIIPAASRDAVGYQPWWIQGVEVILLGDVLAYFGHRLQHRVGFLWRFHEIHHTAEHLDWLATHREHPIDTLYTMTLINVPAFVLGFNVNTLAALLAFRAIWATYLHSNIRLPIGPLRLLIGAPELHHWHHDRSRDAGNYANLAPFLDLLFGTYHCPEHEPEAFGITEPVTQNFVGQLLRPFLPHTKPETMAIVSAGPDALHCASVNSARCPSKSCTTAHRTDGESFAAETTALP